MLKCWLINLLEHGMDNSLIFAGRNYLIFCLRKWITIVVYLIKGLLFKVKVLWEVWAEERWNGIYGTRIFHALSLVMFLWCIVEIYLPIKINENCSRLFIKSYHEKSHHLKINKVNYILLSFQRSSCTFKLSKQLKNQILSKAFRH